MSLRADWWVTWTKHGAFPGTAYERKLSSPGFSISFDDKIATVFCGGLDPVSAAYNVERGTQISVKVGVSPKPIIATLKADGQLVGPGPVKSPEWCRPAVAAVAVLAQAHQRMRFTRRQQRRKNRSARARPGSTAPTRYIATATIP